MSEKKDYFDYVESVLGVKSIMLNPKQNTPLLIAVEDLATYNNDELELLGKMVGALKIDAAKISIVDLTDSQNFQPEFLIFFQNEPVEKTPLKNTIITFSPRILLKKPELKKNAWSDLQKFLTYFNPVN